MVESPASTGRPTQHGRPVAAPRRIHHDRHQQNQAHLEENRDADQNAEHEQRPGHAFGAATLDQSPAQRSSCAGTGEQLPENRPHTQNDRDMAHHFAGAGGKGEGHLFKRNARSRAQCQGGHGKAQRSVQPQPSYEQQQQPDRAGYAGQQVPIMGSGMGGGKSRVHGPIIAAVPPAKRLTVRNLATSSDDEMEFQPFAPMVRLANEGRRTPARSNHKILERDVEHDSYEK